MDVETQKAIARIQPVGVPNHHGTAFLVGPDLILTACHVVANRRENPPEPRADTFQAAFWPVSGKKDNRGPVVTATIVPGQINGDEDWALLKLAFPLPITPLPVAVLNDPTEDIPWRSFGFPTVNPNNFEDDGTLTSQNIIYGNSIAFQLTSTQMSAGEGARAPGFSGAPVLVRNQVAGLLRSALMNEEQQTEAGTLYACPMLLVRERCDSLSFGEIQPPQEFREKPIGLNKDGSGTSSGPKVVSNISIPLSNVFVAKLYEQSKLKEALSNPKKSAIEITGPGGSGKSTFLHDAITNLEASGLSKFDSIFTWSFQQHDDMLDIASVDAFFDAACNCFAIELPEGLAEGARGSLLGQHVFNASGVMILDGFEVVLERSPYDTISDTFVCVNVDIRNLIFELRLSQTFKCIFASRLSSHDIATHFDDHLCSVKMKPLTEPEMKEVLAGLGVRLNDDADSVMPKFGLDPLSLVLVGNYSRKFLRGVLPAPGELETGSGDYSRLRLLDQLLDKYWSLYRGRPELDVLRAVSVLEGTVSASDLNSLADRIAALPGFWDTTDTSPAVIEGALFELCELGLIQLTDNRGSHRISIHHSLRLFFRRRLSTNHPEAFKRLNSILFEHLVDQSPEAPSTRHQLFEMYAAVRHGCLAGRCVDAYSFYERRIHGAGYSALWKFSSFSAEMNALSYFFETPYSTPRVELDSWTSAEISGTAGYCLQSCGRVYEALPSLEYAYLRFLELADMDQAGTCARNLSEALNHVCDYKRAQQIATDGIELCQSHKLDLIQISCVVESIRAAFLACDASKIGALFTHLDELMNSVEYNILQYQRDPRITQYAVIKAIAHYHVFQIAVQSETILDVLLGVTCETNSCGAIPEISVEDMQTEAAWCRINKLIVSDGELMPFVETLFAVMEVRLSATAGVLSKTALAGGAIRLRELMKHIDTFLPNYLKVSAYLDCAGVMLLCGDVEYCIQMASKAVDFADISQASSLKIQGYNLLAQVYAHSGRQKEAETNAHRALTVANEIMIPHSHPLVRFSTSLGLEGTP